MTATIDADVEKIEEPQGKIFYLMALSFLNGRYIEIVVTDDALEDMKKKAFDHMRSGEVMECENICFKASELAFVAFYRKEQAPSQPVSHNYIETDTAKSDQD